MLLVGLNLLKILKFRKTFHFDRENHSAVNPRIKLSDSFFYFFVVIFFSNCSYYVVTNAVKTKNLSNK